jgi:hypothetical protein
VPRPVGDDDRLGQVVEARAAPDGDGHRQHRLEAVRPGQRNRGGGGPDDKRGPIPHVDPQGERVAADRPGRAADQVHSLRGAPQHERRL